MTTAGDELLAELETQLDDRSLHGEHHQLEVPPKPTGGLTSRGGPSALTEADVVARWPFLAPIVELPGPSWRFWLMSRGSLACQRTHDAYAESMWVIDENLVGLNRSPIRGSSARVVSPADFTGTVNEVLALLQQPVRWEDEL